jgi:hypothetical protein
MYPGLLKREQARKVMLIVMRPSTPDASTISSAIF